MVGVPGRSKGCNTCIQRKIKCDQGTPLCGNCRRSDRLCTGYKRRQGYIFTSAVIPDDLQVTSRDEGAVTYQTRWRRTKKRRTAATTRGVPPLIWMQSCVSPSPRRTVSIQTAMRQQFHYHFLAVHFPAEMLDKHHPNVALPSTWMLHLQSVEIQSRVLELSLTALSSARVGLWYNDMNLLYQSHSTYLSALQHLRLAIASPRTRLSDETLAACLALSTYELTGCPLAAPSSFTTHMMGAMMMLQMRGPDANGSPLGFSLFLAFRSLAVMHSLMHRHSNFFSDPEWMNRPWISSAKTPLDKLTDLLFGISAAIQQMSRLGQGVGQQPFQKTLGETIATFSNLDAALSAWYSSFEDSVSGPLYWPELSTLQSRIDDDAESGKLFPISFHFPTFYIGQTITMYWMSAMLVHIHLTAAYRMLANLTPSPTSSSGTPDSLDSSPCTSGHAGSPLSAAAQSREHDDRWRKTVKSLCQSVEYFSQDNMGGMGALAIFSFLHGCKMSLERVPGRDSRREINWISDTVVQVLGKFHFPAGGITDDYNAWRGKR